MVDLEELAAQSAAPSPIVDGGNLTSANVIAADNAVICGAGGWTNGKDANLVALILLVVAVVNGLLQRIKTNLALAIFAIITAPNKVWVDGFQAYPDLAVGIVQDQDRVGGCCATNGKKVNAHAMQNIGCATHA